MNNEILELAKKICDQLDQLDVDEKVEALNQVRSIIHERGPFKDEPVDLVLWTKSEKVKGNDYNPNSVAPPEMKLLERSISDDGFTQPIVAFQESGDSCSTIVDGFHRSTVGKNNSSIAKKLNGYLPITKIRASQEGLSNRMASTIRHNRARGSHDVGLMRDIVGELVESGMSDAWIMKHIGMDADELLRLKQISGIAALFKDRDFNNAWVKGDEVVHPKEGQERA